MPRSAPELRALIDAQFKHLGKKPLNWNNYDTKLQHNTCTDTLHLVPKSRVLHGDFFVEVTADGQAMLDSPYGGTPCILPNHPSDPVG